MLPCLVYPWPSNSSASTFPGLRLQLPPSRLGLCSSGVQTLSVVHAEGTLYQLPVLSSCFQFLPAGIYQQNSQDITNRKCPLNMPLSCLCCEDRITNSWEGCFHLWANVRLLWNHAMGSCSQTHDVGLHYEVSTVFETCSMVKEARKKLSFLSQVSISFSMVYVFCRKIILLSLSQSILSVSIAPFFIFCKNKNKGPTFSRCCLDISFASFINWLLSFLLSNHYSQQSEPFLHQLSPLAIS